MRPSPGTCLGALLLVVAACAPKSPTASSATVKRPSATPAAGASSTHTTVVGPSGGASIAPHSAAPSTTSAGGASSLPGESSSPGASAQPSSPAASHSPGASAAPASAAPTASPAVNESNFTYRVSGVVYDESGAPVQGATVTGTATSKQTQQAPVATTDTSGSYVFGTIYGPYSLEVKATYPNGRGTVREALVTPPPTNGAIATQDFGAPLDKPTNAGAALYLSSYPEIMGFRVVPSPPAGHLQYSWSVSEPMTATAQNRLADAARILPIASTPNNVTSVGDLDASPAPPGLVAGQGITDTVLDSLPVTLTWDATGTTFTFDIPTTQMTAGSGLKYQLVLCGGAGPVLDLDGRALGTDPNGSWTAPISSDLLVRRVFRKAGATLAPTDTTAVARWQATHTDAWNLASPGPTPVPTPS